MHSTVRRCGEGMTEVRQFQVTFDCAIPERVARFWCAAMGYVVTMQDVEGNEFCLD